MNFNETLKSLPNWSGRKLYFFECCLGYINYDEVHHKFQKLIDNSGYRPYSQSLVKELTTKEKEEIELDIEQNTFIFSIYDMITQKREILINAFNTRSKK